MRKTTVSEGQWQATSSSLTRVVYKIKLAFPSFSFIEKRPVTDNASDLHKGLPYNSQYTVVVNVRLTATPKSKLPVRLISVKLKVDD